MHLDTQILHGLESPALVAEIDKYMVREGDALIRAYEKEIAGRE